MIYEKQICDRQTYNNSKPVFLLPIVSRHNNIITGTERRPQLRRTKITTARLNILCCVMSYIRALKPVPSVKEYNLVSIIHGNKAHYYNNA